MENPLKRPYLFKLDPVLVVILVAVTFLLLFRLDHRPFWQDEAETACLARNVLKYGVPQAFDGVNLISQEEGREFNGDYLWRWSPWLQIYLTAAAFKIGGLSTWVGRLPFALLGLACVILVYLLIKHHYRDLAWARWAAALLAFSVPFLLFARQCRYYSAGAFLVLVSLYAFRQQWQSRWGPALLLVGSLGLLFYSNYLIFLTYAGALLLAAVLFYLREMANGRTFIIVIFLGLTLVPGLAIFRIWEQASMVDLLPLWTSLNRYFGDLFQFMVPLPVALALIWRWRRPGIPQDPKERFAVFLTLIILVNLSLLALIPYCEHRYMIHLYPLGAILLGWVVLKVWRYQKFCGALLGLLLLFTNWLQVVPLDWLRITNRPMHNDLFMLTYPNLPLKLYVGELLSPYPDVNRNLIQFFKTNAQPGETILITYDDLPLQFYTDCRVLGGLQGGVPLPPGETPDWVVKRWHTRWNRDLNLIKSEDFIRKNLNLAEDYQAVVLPFEDEIFGNRADPYYHRFVPPVEPLSLLTIYQKRSKIACHVP
jgi:hypothetical protein